MGGLRVAERAVSVDGLRDELRKLSVLKGAAPEFDPADAPESPMELFSEWFMLAVRSGVTEPHAMTLSTVDADGRPSARVLILKDVDSAGWHFAISTLSRKGSELAAHPFAALTFYWPELVRQVRVSGPVVADAPAVAAADFLARPDGSRQMALTRRQSQPFDRLGELDEALELARQELESAPDLVPDEWQSYAVRPDEVEFWQGDPQRRHQRLRYSAAGDSWSRTRLWP
ncbi:pyridoxine/pyridoxamine 5'-phosphate oxidase [Nocardia sp. CA-128927]|uniref:pyridoxine/pyridoxamine 5'-phosphate oxidase n=1 Tax=Nocardia sp. CA-128927 TaxID=3239975 RepID=UPI003D97B795